MRVIPALLCLAVLALVFAAWFGTEGSGLPAMAPASLLEGPGPLLEPAPRVTEPVVDGPDRPALLPRTMVSVASVGSSDGSQSVGTDPLGDAPDQPVAEPRTSLELKQAQEILLLEHKLHWMQLDLDLCGAGSYGAVGRWLAALPPEESERWRTTEAELLQEMVLCLEDYPVQLLHTEALWMMERIRKDDWLDWGPFPEQAIVLFLGPERLKRELTEEQLAPLREYWSEEGYFD